MENKSSNLKPETNLMCRDHCAGAPAMGMANLAWTVAALVETATAASVDTCTEGITQAWRDADCSTHKPLP